jgi:hypothetical protein
MTGSSEGRDGDDFFLFCVQTFVFHGLSSKMVAILNTDIKMPDITVDFLFMPLLLLR